MELREYQRAAVEAAVRSLSANGRAQVVMACGTGKTLVGRAVAGRVAGAGGLVGVLLPSLALLGQTLRAWREAGVGGFEPFVVCSDDVVGDEGGPEHSAARASVNETVSVLGDLPVTTDPAQIAAWLARPGGATTLRVVFATYQSAPRIAEAFRDHSGVALPRFDLLVFDEAHRTAADPDAHFATALHDAHVPAARRLFLTATPRVQVGDPDADGGEPVFVGIDDQALFGPRVFTLSVAEAIEAGMLSDYRVVVVGVSDAEIHKLVLDNAPLQVGPADVPAATLAAQVALAGAAAEFDLRRILVFCGRVKTSRRIAATLPHTIDALPPDRRPRGRLAVRHVDGTSTADDRDQAIAALTAPSNGGWTVVSNVKVLGEGVDCPALDAVVFADPRSGQIDVVQSVGRAIRLHPERDAPAVILLPVYLAPGENGEAVLDGSRFRNVWQILRALRDHDADLGAQIARARRRLIDFPDGDPAAVLPDRIVLRLPEDADARFFTSFATLLLEGTASPRERAMERLQAYVDEHGHATPPHPYVDAAGFRLGAWTASQRSLRAAGRLDPRAAAALEALPGWTWHVNQDRWDTAYAAVLDYARIHGCPPPITYVAPDERRLGHWLNHHRHFGRDGRLPADRVARLESIPGWSWSPFDDRWQRGFDALTAYAAEHGHLDVPMEYKCADGFALGIWVCGERYDRERMEENRRTLLDSLPRWGWTGKDAHTHRMIPAVTAYHAEHGTVSMPRDYSTEAEPKLGLWMFRRRNEYGRGTIDPATKAALEAVPGFVWSVADQAFINGLAALRRFVAEHGHASPPKGYRDAQGYRPASFVALSRLRYADARMPEHQIAQLETVPGWAWKLADRILKGSPQQQWEGSFAALVRHAAEHGHTRIPDSYVDAYGIHVGRWVIQRRAEWRRGTLSPERAARLEAVDGWSWDTSDHIWSGWYETLAAYTAEHGTASVPQQHTTADGRRLGQWATQQRQNHRLGRLPTQRATALEALPGWAWSARGRTLTDPPA